MIELAHIIATGQTIVMDTDPFESYMTLQFNLRLCLRRYWDLIQIVRYHRVKFPHPFNESNAQSFYDGSPVCNGNIHLGDPRVLYMLGDMISGVNPENTFKGLELGINLTDEILVIIDPTREWLILSEF